MVLTKHSCVGHACHIGVYAGFIFTFMNNMLLIISTIYPWWEGQQPSNPTIHQYGIRGQGHPMLDICLPIFSQKENMSAVDISKIARSRNCSGWSGHYHQLSPLMFSAISLSDKRTQIQLSSCEGVVFLQIMRIRLSIIHIM